MARLGHMVFDGSLLDCKASKSQLVDYSISQKLEEERKARLEAESAAVALSSVVVWPP